MKNWWIRKKNALPIIQAQVYVGMFSLFPSVVSNFCCDWAPGDCHITTHTHIWGEKQKLCSFSTGPWIGGLHGIHSLQNQSHASPWQILFAPHARAFLQENYASLVRSLKLPLPFCVTDDSWPCRVMSQLVATVLMRKASPLMTVVVTWLSFPAILFLYHPLQHQQYWGLLQHGEETHIWQNTIPWEVSLLSYQGACRSTEEKQLREISTLSPLALVSCFTVSDPLSDLSHHCASLIGMSH